MDRKIQKRVVGASNASGGFVSRVASCGRHYANVLADLEEDGACGSHCPLLPLQLGFVFENSLSFYFGW
jgi:hypothetical protein